jgi:putative endonuclease
MYYVYVLVSESRNYIYVGITDNLDRRINAHNAGHNKTTRAYRPFRTLLTEQYPSRLEARAREKYLKSGIGKEFLKNILTQQLS